ncbi:putative integral membrane protein [Babesia bovis T2Bo]|uniref:Membrane protein, putative n=1 Tax=Babesia bovis TaxID=5865 RepID=A7AUX4_BABBO|nr:putative integral membrane protein [Babesia bovis T2Bo]EDO06735.1 putative integral membrane protein [Babesia bovis T2Bo]|eukprot:XP_001610303.1 membrane protein [Babesia bovis T2Bo]
MLVYPVLVLALGALWPLDWTTTELHSLSPVTGHYHGAAWAMAEKVIGGDDPEEVVVVEADSTDEVANNKETQKSCEGWFTKWYMVALCLVVLIVLGIVVAVIKPTNGGEEGRWAGVAVIVVIVIFVIIIHNWNNIRKVISRIGCSGSSLKKLNAKNVD